VAAGGVLLTLVAFMFDASPLFVPGIAFTALGLATPAWISLSAGGSSVRRRLHADRVLEGEPLEATIEVRRGRFGLPGARVIDPLADHSVAIGRSMSLIGGAREAHVRIVASFPRRGARQIAPSSLIIQDALELARVTRTAEGPAQELLVLPRTEPVRWTDHDRGLRASLSTGAAPSDPLAAVDVDGTRPYRVGTPASRIHWAALARGAGLLERRLRADGDTRPLVVLDARAGESEHLDAAVRAAASLALELARRGGCGLLLPGERRAIAVEPDLASWPGTHARLAVVEGGPGTRPPILAGGARLGPVLYVAAQPLERLPTALAAVGRGGCVIVLPRELTNRMQARPSFEVAGCYGFAVRARAGSSPFAERAA
jgi:uncharacterized protein (DUF58 family)